MRLIPAMLARYAKAGLYEDCQKYYIDYCSDCGACAYVCPAKIPLLRYIRIAKRELNKKVASE
jgi:electron transport complex protein RnfC